MRHAQLLLILGLSLILAPGCLSSTYTIPKAEAARLSKLSPDARGQKIRVVQDVFGEDVPADTNYEPYRGPVASGRSGGTDANAHSHHVHIDTCYAFRSGVRVRTCRTPIRPRVIRGYGRPATRVERVGGGSGPAPVEPPGNIPSGGDVPAQAKGGGGFQGGGSGIDVGDGRAIAVIIVAAAAVATVALIATEGMRYDGWVGVNPNHPVHLFGDRGHLRTLPLSALSLSDIQAADSIVIHEEQGDGFDFFRRAPLDRQGFAWRMEGGTSAMLMPDNQATYVPAVGLSFGYFPLHELGILTNVTFGWGDYQQTQLFSVRYGLELNVLPISLPHFHLGGYGTLGMTFAAMDEGAFPDHSYHVLKLGTGLLTEFDLTTRLSLFGRIGPFWEEHRNGFELPGVEASVGVAIY